MKKIKKNNILKIKRKENDYKYYIILDDMDVYASAYECEKLFIRNDIFEDEYIKKHTYKTCKVYELRPIVMRNQHKFLNSDLKNYDYEILYIDFTTTYVTE
jgi:hypothetical protein